VRVFLCLVILAAAGCGGREPAPPPPRRDSGTPDGFDAGVISRRDAGPSGPVVDGTIEDDEWEDAAEATAEVETDAPGSELTRLLARVVDGSLFVGVEGALADGDALVVWVDRDLGGEDGWSDLATLVDEDGSLDSRVSSPVMTPDAFAVDWAWGTTQMPRTPVGLDEEAGWRDLTAFATFEWVASETAPTVCSESACETSIPLDTLGGEAPRTLALFARIVRADGTFANQTLPEDDPAAPGIASVLLELDDGVEMTDGGVPDGGPDASVPGEIVLDGTVSPGEWSAATVFENRVTPGAVFEGNEATVLYVAVDSTTLRVAIEGRLTAGNAIVLYLDDDVGGPEGIASPTALDDFVGDLDTALSKAMILPSELRIDWAWGTLDMNRTAAVGDDRMGWRDVGSNPSAFGNVSGATVCGMRACETEVRLSDLGVASGDEVGLFVRLVSATSAAFSNMTLPADDGLQPETVSVYASFVAP